MTEEEMSDIINRYHEHYEYDTRFVYCNLKDRILRTVNTIEEENCEQ